MDNNVLLRELESASRRGDICLIGYFHEKLKREMHNYNPFVALEGFWRGLAYGLHFAQECTEDRRMWNLRYNLRDIKVASEYLGLGKF